MEQENKNVESKISKKFPCTLFNNNSLPFYLLFDQCWVLLAFSCMLAGSSHYNQSGMYTTSLSVLIRLFNSTKKLGQVYQHA